MGAGVITTHLDRNERVENGVEGVVGKDPVLKSSDRYEYALKCGFYFNRDGRL